MPVYDSFDIFVADLEGKHHRTINHRSQATDAKATVSPKGDKIVFFTSTRKWWI